MGLNIKYAAFGQLLKESHWEESATRSDQTWPEDRT